MQQEIKRKFVLKESKTGHVIAYFATRVMADKRLDEILDRHPWARDFLRIEEVSL